MVRKKTVNTFITLGLIGGGIVLLAKANQRFDILGSVERGLTGIPSAFIRGVGGAAQTAQETGEDLKKNLSEEEQERLEQNKIDSLDLDNLDFLSGKSFRNVTNRESGDLFDFSSLEQLVDSFKSNISSQIRKNEILRINPLNVRGSTTGLRVIGFSGVDTGDVGIRNKVLPRRAFSRQQPTVIAERRGDLIRVRPETLRKIAQRERATAERLGL